MLAQIPPDWDPHQRLEYLKMSIWTSIADAVRRVRGELRKSIVEREESLNDMHKLKSSACALGVGQDKDRNRS